MILNPGARRRYMVVLRLGGVYADVDTEARQPMDALIRPRDTMVVCWENEFESAAEAEHRHYVRSRQASTGHPSTHRYGRKHAHGR